MGTYITHSEATKRRVVEAARAGQDRATIADHRDVPYDTALHWVKRYGNNNEHIVFTQRSRHQPRHDAQRDGGSAFEEYDVQVTPQAVKKRIGGLGFTLKKSHDEPQYMNIPKNKQKRYEYLYKLYEYQTAGQSVYYMDETNINLWTVRTRVRSKKGERAPRKKVSGGGQNMHVIACISLNGLVYYETQFGANDATNMKEFTRGTLRSIRLLCLLHEVLLVSDNAPCHTSIEEVLAEEELAGAAFLRLDPYSPMLNPIENVFSAFKAKVKEYIRAHQKDHAHSRGNDYGSTQKSISCASSPLFLLDMATAEECAKYYRHSFGFHRAVFDKDDIKVGN